jgi:hypothetical protein
LNPPFGSISRNQYDCDDNECRDQRKRAIECFRSGLCGIVERRHGLGRRPQFANEPANISRLHGIRRYRDLFDMIAFRTVERADFKSCRPRRNACKHHARSAFRAAELLNCEQWDCGQVVGHAFHPWVRRERKNSQSPVDAEQDGDGNQHALPALDPLFNFDHSLKKSNATGEFSNFDAATVADRKWLHVIWLCMAKSG